MSFARLDDLCVKLRALAAEHRREADEIDALIALVEADAVEGFFYDNFAGTGAPDNGDAMRDG